MKKFKNNILIAIMLITLLIVTNTIHVFAFNTSYDLDSQNSFKSEFSEFKNSLLPQEISATSEEIYIAENGTTEDLDGNTKLTYKADTSFLKAIKSTLSGNSKGRLNSEISCGVLYEGENKPVKTVITQGIYKYDYDAKVWEGIASTQHEFGSILPVFKSTLETPIKGTCRYKIIFYITVIYKDGKVKNTDLLESSNVLFNSVAKAYPQYTDTKSGKKMHEPALNLYKIPESDRVKWGPTEINEYRAWYENTHNNGKPIAWKGVLEIHHINPRAYGGTNVKYNLIPLPYSFHRSEINPWWTKY